MAVTKVVWRTAVEKPRGPDDRATRIWVWTISSGSAGFTVTKSALVALTLAAQKKF